MSFRAWLRVFFFSIVIIPMVAVAFVLFTLTEDSEKGRADAGIAAGLRNGFSVYADDADRAEPALRRVAADDELRSALARREAGRAEAEMRRVLRREPTIVAIELYDPSGAQLARAGSADAIAPKSAPLANQAGARVGSLSVSVTEAASFVRRVARLSGMEVSVFRGERRLASTKPGIEGGPELGTADDSRNFEIGGQEYRGRVGRVPEPVGPPIQIAVYREAGAVSDAISDSRLLIGIILAAVLLGALGFSALVVRALQNQIGKFLDAARRLAGGDFEHPVPTAGRDEFAALGREFNSMSEQLAAKIDEVERKRRELEETIRRLGVAFASGLDRQGVVELAVETAVDGCAAEAGRAFPLDPEAFRTIRIGIPDHSLDAGLEAAERNAFRVRPVVGRQLLESADEPRQDGGHRQAIEASVDGSHALAVPLSARLRSSGSRQFVGVISIARRGNGFSREEQELLEYLAGQAVVSIENAELHETVQRQAVTDELTGLSNVRELHTVLDREIERSRRFSSPLGLVMLDIDDFKQVNDEHGHQQGDEVLAAVASVLRDHSRDIDEPARYGGEELAVVLPQTDSEGAAQLAERMREAVERLRVPDVGGNAKLEITASFGVASLPETASDKASLIAAADAALYRAKRNGKNRVERAEPVTAAG
jgi:diguanylate cyclase (GGDEF)-like protein